MTDSIDISQKAKDWGINYQKPFFPVNSMRFFYLLLVDHETAGNQEAIDKVNQAVPKVSAILDQRERLMLDSPSASPIEVLEGCQQQISDLLAVVNSPNMATAINYLFTSTFPLQQTLLTGLNRHFEAPNLAVADLMMILKIRAMDSALYSATMVELINSYKSEAERQQRPSIDVLINQTLQLNDLVDAVVYAKQDIEAGNATIIEIVKKTEAAKDPEAFIRKTLDELYPKGDYISGIPEIITFLDKLKDVAFGVEGEEETNLNQLSESPNSTSLTNTT